jgi:hypothetical protein
MIHQGDRLLDLLNEPQKKQSRPRGVLVAVSLSVILILCVCIAGSILVMRSLQSGSFASLLTEGLRDIRLTETADFATRSSAAAGLEHPPDDWFLLFEDTFEDDSAGWSLDEDSPEFGTINRTILDGVYRWEAHATQGAIWPSCAPGVGTVTDFFASVEIEKLSRPINGFSTGLMFRIDGDEHYVVEASCGVIKVVRRTSDGDWVFPLGWEDAPMTCDAPNKLAVLGKGSHFWFFVNDTYVADFEDTSLPRGGVGLSISVYDDPIEDAIPPKVAAYDNFQLYVPTETASAASESRCPEITSAP